jgi:hypothetical protein
MVLNRIEIIARSEGHDRDSLLESRGNEINIEPNYRSSKKPVVANGV